MATFTNNDVATGDVVQASDHNTQGALIAAIFNGGIDNGNISPSAAIAGSKLADAGITNSKLASGAGEPNGAWTSFTPVFTNFTLGNGTASGEYTKVGRTVKGRVYVACGSTTAFGTSMTIDPPTSAATSYTTRRFVPCGQATYHDNGTNIYFGSLFFDSSTASGKMVANVYLASGTYATRQTTTSSVPFTIASGDTLAFTFEYEGAS